MIKKRYIMFIREKKRRPKMTLLSYYLQKLRMLLKRVKNMRFPFCQHACRSILKKIFSGKMNVLLTNAARNSPINVKCKLIIKRLQFVWEDLKRILIQVIIQIQIIKIKRTKKLKFKIALKIIKLANKTLSLTRI